MHLTLTKFLIMFATLLFVTATSLIIFAVYLTAKRSLYYWEKKNIPYLKPVILLGNFADYILLRKYVGQFAQSLCQKLPNAPYFGAFYGTEPTLIVQDPELIKIVMTKDFYFFNGREVSKYNHKEMLAQSLFFSYGDQWKVLRQNLTPLFSSAKMKNMFHLINKCAHVFERILDQVVQSSDVIEVRSLTARFTMDCVGSCAFGIDTNTMEKVDDNPFKTIGDVIFEIDSFRAFKNVARAIWPAIFYGLGFRMFPKRVETFFSELLIGVFGSRQSKVSSRNDFVDLVLKLKNNKEITGDSMKNMKSKSSSEKINLEISDDLLVAQCFLIFAAGYETSATTISFTLFELAKKPDIQAKIFGEIDEYLSRHDNVLKYECVTEMPYLEACIDEALRLYPVLGVLTREVAEDYTFACGLKVEKGIRIHLPVYHLHHNPDHFPEPEEYRPERFFGAERRNIKPYSYMPFGEGPRICIGMRFAKMQMIAGLITLLKKYRLELAPGMASKVEFEPKSLITQPKGGIKLKFIERDGWEYRLLKSPQA